MTFVRRPPVTFAYHFCINSSLVCDEWNTGKPEARAVTSLQSHKRVTSSL